jgi:hypothetical protein
MDPQPEVANPSLMGTRRATDHDGAIVVSPVAGASIRRGDEILLVHDEGVSA